MKQYAKRFEKSLISEDGVDVQLNDYLNKYPYLEVTHVDYVHGKQGTCVEYLFVVFKMSEGV